MVNTFEDRFLAMKEICEIVSDFFSERKLLTRTTGMFL